MRLESSSIGFTSAAQLSSGCSRLLVTRIVAISSIRVAGVRAGYPGVTPFSSANCPVRELQVIVKVFLFEAWEWPERVSFSGMPSRLFRQPTEKQRSGGCKRQSRCLRRGVLRQSGKCSISYPMVESFSRPWDTKVRRCLRAAVYPDASDCEAKRS